MEREFTIKLGRENYYCLIDLLCRANRLDEAYQVVREMTYKLDVLVWGAFLGGCKARNDIAL
ncbi:hypothetical protein IEQ34_011192 [Dendrobium chrysotoxum]|uniref:Pentatricopeptide repeat-containing protein n=1 Tax=Dendrobium chrysotoxum TaxID=161865 RepID=A0AAV7GFJ3_DENCH|nr:hypothetical protein IEQ34_011192 [Dendrobium chrysotoxum]